MVDKSDSPAYSNRSPTGVSVETSHFNQQPKDNVSDNTNRNTVYQNFNRPVVNLVTKKQPGFTFSAGRTGISY